MTICDQSPFAEAVIRGVRKSGWVDKNGTPHGEAFEPDDRIDRADGLVEASINWDDDPNVLALTLSDRSSSAHGTLRVPTSHLEWVASTPHGTACVFRYERRKVTGNAHHGNLLFLKSASPRQKRLVGEALAIGASFAPRPT